MNKSVSIYLDVVRFLAALAVFAVHISSRAYTGGMLWRFDAEGDAAVSVFFVLSGYVIAHVMATHERDAATFTASRFARLYSVVLPALLLTLICDQLGLLRNSAFYVEYAQKSPWDPSLLRYVASALFVNRSWLINGFQGYEPGTNTPFWSLSCEAAYYTAIAFLVFLRGAPRVIAILLLCLLAGPTIIILAPLWFLGFALYHTQTKIRVPALLGIVMWVVGCVVCLTAYKFETVRAPWDLPWADPFFWVSHYQLGYLLCRYVAAIAFAVSLMGFIRIADWFAPLLASCERPIRWLGSLTFPLYLFHRPLIFVLMSYSFWPHTSVWHAAWLVAGTTVVVVSLGPICDGTKTFYKRLFFGIFNRLGTPAIGLAGR